MGGSSAAALLAHRIRDRGPVTVAEFMSVALYHPEHGYYASRPVRTGRDGDFLTSVSAGPVFGRLLARQFAEMWQVLGAPGGRLPDADGHDGADGRIDLVEAAASNGQLARDILDAAQEEAPGFLDAVRLHLVDASPSARASHAGTLGPHAARLATSSARLPDQMHGILYANELLDALPVHGVIGTPAGLAERYVALAPDSTPDAPRFIEQAGPLSNDAIGKHLASLGVALEPGQRAEVNLSALAWLTRACSALHRGFLVVIDYGHHAGELYSPAHGAGTLTAMRSHVVAPDVGRTPAWLAEPGDRDITSHVDLTSVVHIAEALGCEVLGLSDQTYFLMALATGTAGDGTPDTLRLPETDHRAFKTLVMPGGLGSTMKVLVLGRGVGRPRLTGLPPTARLT